MKDLLARLTESDFSSSATLEIRVPTTDQWLKTPQVLTVELSYLVKALRDAERVEGLLELLAEVRDHLMSTDILLPPNRVRQLLNKIEIALPDPLKDGYYWFHSERASTRSIAQLVSGAWYLVGEADAHTLEQLRTRGWKLDGPVETEKVDD